MRPKPHPQIMQSSHMNWIIPWTLRDLRVLHGDGCGGGIGFEAPAHLKPVSIGQPDVEKDQRWLVPCQAQRLRPVARFQDVEPAAPQHVTDRKAWHTVVVHIHDDGLSRLGHESPLGTDGTPAERSAKQPGSRVA